MRARLLILALAAPLAGCIADLNVLGDAIPQIPQIPQIPPGEELIVENGVEIIEPIPPAPACQARARYFRGTVSIPCEEIARTVAP